MDSSYYGPVSPERLLPADPRKRLLAMAVLGVLSLAALIYIGPALLPLTADSSRVKVSSLVYPSSLSHVIAEPVGETWTMPAHSVAVDDVVFTLDTGNNRILKLDQDGRVLDIFGGQEASPLALRMPMAIASDGQRLFVANSLAHEVLILDFNGAVQRRFALPPDPAGRPHRLVGMALLPGGGIVLSDAEHHHVYRLDEAGEIVWTAGTGTRTTGKAGFNSPGAVAADDAGNVYVVDTLNARIVKLSLEGKLLAEIGRRGDIAGHLTRPKGVAVDGAGRVFVSDGLLAAVQVFAPDGRYLGLVGREKPEDEDSASLFVVPHGLTFSDDTLLVTDRYAGVLAFELAGTRSPD